MPFLIRIIIRRVIAAIIGVLTFLGLSPEATIPTSQEAQFRIEEQKKIVENILEIGRESDNPQKFIDTINEASEKINTKRKQIENSPTRENVIPVIKQQKNNTPPEIKIAQKSVAQTKPNIQETPKEKVERELQPEGEMEGLADVVVNIICTQQKSGFTSASTGSGVLISSDGIVITNAHVAQFFLLEDAGYPVDCAIYRENIPTFGYRADIMYISPEWIQDNYKLISDPNPRGTGENDYALLQITKNTNPVLPLPSYFSHAKINLDTNIYKERQPIEVAGFPGAPLSVFDLAKSGSLKTDDSKINEMFKFSNGSFIDIFSTEQTHVAARGASGGGLFYDNDLIGITVTTSSEGSGAKINAITTTYINKDLDSDYGKSLIEMISGDTENLKQTFQNKHLNKLSKLLENEL